MARQRETGSRGDARDNEGRHRPRLPCPRSSHRPRAAATPSRRHLRLQVGSTPRAPGQRRRLRLGCSGSARAAPAPACGRVERPRRRSPRSVSSRRAATRRTPLRSAGCPARPSGPTRVGSPAGGAAPPLRLRCSGLLRSGLPVQLSRCSANYRLDFSAPFASSPSLPGLYDEAPPVLPFLGELPQPFAMPAYCLATEWQRPGPGLNNAGPGPGRSPAVCRANA